MTGDRLAVIDLGSNTFHLLICELTEDENWIVVYKERIYVKLASGGLGHIDAPSTGRAVEAMTRFAFHLEYYGVIQARAIGTSALREAVNGPAVADHISSLTGVNIEIIDGHSEAGYILRGIQSAIPHIDGLGLVMDIGGGSVEFILFEKDHVTFKRSYNIGVAVLYKKFHHTDPISKNEILALEQLLDQELGELIDAIKTLPAYYLIGASGSFEILNDVLPHTSTSEHWSELEFTHMEEYLDHVISSNLQERRAMAEIPEERLDYVVVAYILIRYMIKRIRPERLFYCDFALKEGVLAEMIAQP